MRHFGRLDAAVRRLVPHAPRFPTRAVLLVAGYELLDGAAGPVEDGLVAKIVHHAVEQAKGLASPAEARLVNAVVRKLAPVLAAPPPPKLAPAEVLADYFSHPVWLVQRWLLAFGADATRKLLEWNQQPAPVFARWRAFAAAKVAGDAVPGGAELPGWLAATPWPGFFAVAPGHWPEVEARLKAGDLYLQDPATRLAVELLAPQPGESVLDLCAAPGGKSLLIADTLAAAAPGGTAAGRIVALDLPPVEADATGPAAGARQSPRIERLKENLARVRGVDVALVLADVQRGAATLLREHNLPEAYPAVLIDVPCSNTGVMRHRADVKWRLQDTDIAKHGRQQLALLHAAARLVAPGGRLVYSTCSLEPEENEQVVRAFFDSRAGGPFKLERTVQSLPWLTGHDGAGAFLLRKQA